MERNKVVRLTVGAECDKSVEVWRFWIQGDEFYFGCRNTLGRLKVSLHSGGVWKLEHGHERFNINERIAFSEEWDLGPVLVFPKVPVDRLEIRGEHLKVSNLINLELGDLWQARFIQILFSRVKGRLSIPPVTEEIDWEWIGELRTLGKVALASYLRPLKDDEISYIQDQKRKAVIWYKDKLPQIGVYTNFFIFESAHQRCPSMLFSIPLGQENMKIESA